jgi:hypothetical protein
LRSQNFFCDLQHQLELNPNDAHLQARWKQQKPLRPQDDYGGNRLNNTELRRWNDSAIRALCNACSVCRIAIFVWVTMIRINHLQVLETELVMEKLCLK